MQHCSSNSLSLLAKSKGKASKTLESVLLLGVGSSQEEEEGVEAEEAEGEVGVEVVVVWFSNLKEIMLVMMLGSGCLGQACTREFTRVKRGCAESAPLSCHNLVEKLVAIHDGKDLASVLKPVILLRCPPTKFLHKIFIGENRLLLCLPQL
jgi:hypothetical protein